MQSKKRVKQPSSSSSPSKPQILSQLAVARKIIKDKFKRAYLDRMERERKVNETLKPITSEIVTLRPAKEAKNGQKEKQNISGNDYTPRLSMPSSSTPLEGKQGFFTPTERTPSTIKRINHTPGAPKQPSENRRRVIEFLKSPKAKEIFEKSRRQIDEMIGPSHSSSSSGSEASGIYNRTRTRRPKEMERAPGAYSRAPLQPAYRKKIGGKGVKSYDFQFIPYDMKNHIIYEYFDDPNEICDRLRLLVSSRMAGNSNHMQEISSIIEELRELGCIV